MAINRKTKFSNHNPSRAKNFKRSLIFSGNKFKSKPKVDKKQFNKIWRILLILIIIFSLFYFVFCSEYFRINEIIVQGNNLVSEENIIQFVPHNSNMFLFSSSKVKKNILYNNPEIKNIEIFRGIPNALKIVVLEHDNKVIWESGGNQYLLSSQGRVTKKINQGESFPYPRVVDSKNIPVELGLNIVSPSFVSFIVNVNNNLLDVSNLSPSYFQVTETTFDVDLYTNSGIYIKLNTMRSSAKQLDNLKKVLVSKKSEIKEYVDLRIDGLAYYK